MILPPVCTPSIGGVIFIKNQEGAFCVALSSFVLKRPLGKQVVG